MRQNLPFGSIPLVQILLEGTFVIAVWCEVAKIVQFVDAFAAFRCLTSSADEQRNTRYKTIRLLFHQMLCFCHRNLIDSTPFSLDSSILLSKPKYDPGKEELESLTVDAWPKSESLRFSSISIETNRENIQYASVVFLCKNTLHR